MRWTRTSVLSIVLAGALAAPVMAAQLSGSFTDVDPRDPHAAAIDWLAANDITKGCAPELYCGGDAVSRAQLASFLQRLATAGVVDAATVDGFSADQLRGQRGERGEQGETGVAGPQGTQGERGDRGDTGAPGEQGSRGETGQTGDTGAQGIQGQTGQTGAQGERGDTGAQGDRGDTGATGARGERGETGAQGVTGDTGNTGAQGIQGLTGDTGARGERGETGAQGMQGMQGMQGLTGDTGAQGIQGLTGMTGDAGGQGIQGETGAQGIQGDRGADGNTIYGVDGAPDEQLGRPGDLYLDTATITFYGPKTPLGWGDGVSLIGRDGLDGQDGLDGAAGESGAAGTNGTNGATGATGTAGTNGETGLQGPEGPAGPQGEQGVVGEAGATWHTGEGPPAAALGRDGDLYLDTVTGDHSTKVDGTWTLAGNLSGPQGQQGPEGPQGPAGSSATLGLTTYRAAGPTIRPNDYYSPTISVATCQPNDVLLSGGYSPVGSYNPEMQPMVMASYPTDDGTGWQIDAVINWWWGSTGDIRSYALCAVGQVVAP